MARGEPAFSAEDPFCISRMNRRYHESRQALYRGEATARFALVDRLADCATPRIDKVELERLRSRLTVEASNRGVDDRKFYGSIDPGLLVSFDLYELLEQSKPLQKSLAPSSKPILAIRDLDPATSPVVAVAAQRAILRFDSDAGQAIDSWIRAITARNAANELTYAAADQELKACDQIVGNLIRRRWGSYSRSPHFSGQTALKVRQRPGRSRPAGHCFLRRLKQGSPTRSWFPFLPQKRRTPIGSVLYGSDSIPLNNFGRRREQG